MPTCVSTWLWGPYPSAGAASGRAARQPLCGPAPALCALWLARASAAPPSFFTRAVCAALRLRGRSLSRPAFRPCPSFAAGFRRLRFGRPCSGRAWPCAAGGSLGPPSGCPLRGFGPGWLHARGQGRRCRPLLGFAPERFFSAAVGFRRRASRPSASAFCRSLRSSGSRVALAGVRPGASLLGLLWLCATVGCRLPFAALFCSQRSPLRPSRPRRPRWGLRGAQS